MNVLDILGEGGAISQLLPNYEARPQQLQMALAVEDAIRRGGHLLVEAGTGVGKSFAYLVPAVLAALRSKDRRVVISTHTIGLQEQLISKDVPFLQRVSPKPFSAMLVKGRGNYLSKRRLRVASAKMQSLFTDSSAWDQVRQLYDWSQRTRDGSRSDLEIRPMPSVWEHVESDSSNCLGPKCKDYGECFYFKARRNIGNTQVLIVNHSLFFADLALRSLGEGAAILPKYDAVIFDEAHTLEDVAAEHLGVSVTRGQIEYGLNKLYLERSGAAVGLFTTFGENSDIVLVQQARRDAEDFFYRVLSWRQEEERRTKKRPSDSFRVREPIHLQQALVDTLKRLAARLSMIAEKIDDNEQQIEYEAAATRFDDFADSLDIWLNQKIGRQVYWIEGGEKPNKVSLHSAPIEVGPLLREMLFERIPTVVMTSATLSVGGARGFDHFKQRIGFPDDATLMLGSPFNYRKQSEMHLIRSMPDPSTQADKFEAACNEKILEFVAKTQGQAFVLFTSNQTLQRCAASLREPLEALGLTLISQGDGATTKRMLEQFRATPGAVLFGVDSFWQGVDIQGETLTNVIITKLPFMPPDRPLVEARTEAIHEAGGDAFMEFSLPQAIIKLKQGFGRLIRTTSDRGMVVILDPRMVTKRYGRHFLDALPDCRRFIDGQPTRD